MLLVGAVVVGWSVGRASIEAVAAARVPEQPVKSSAPAEPVVQASRRPRLRRPVRIALAGALVALFVAGAGFLARPDDARAPLVDAAVASREHAQAAQQAEAARLRLLRHLELAGIAARRVGLPEREARNATKLRRPAVLPSDRAIALDTFLQALGAQTILTGLDASRDQLQQQVLSDPRVHIYPGGRGDVTSGKLDVRVLAIIEYLAQANGDVSVSCLIAGHSLYVHGRPGVISAHIFGRGVDISAVGGVPILDHQGPGSATERAIKQLLALP